MKLPLAFSLALLVQASVSKSDSQCLLQGSAQLELTPSDLPRTSISREELVAAESLFVASAHLEADHTNVGGDRMSQRHHNYAPIYARHMAPLLKSGEAPTLVEVGILTGSGLAMWSKLFPDSPIFGFDLNVSSYHGNLQHLRSLGFDDGRVKVTSMNQLDGNTELLQATLGGLRPQIVVDDGLHNSEAGLTTFLSMKPVLAERFVYFIEDIPVRDIAGGSWDRVKTSVLGACPTCEFAIDCPHPSEKAECVAVIHTLTELPQPGIALDTFSKESAKPAMFQDFELKRPDYETIEVSMPWETGEAPLVSCPLQPLPSLMSNITDADASLIEATNIFCEAGLGSMVEFYVDPRFRANYDRIKSPEGWIDQAYLSYIGLKNTKDTTGAQEDLLVQSAHRFSKYPFVLANFGRRMPRFMTPERFPNLVVMHARQSATSIGKGFNLNKLNSMLFTKVKGGLVLDADQWVNQGLDVMVQRGFEETTKDYPYPVLPVHFMSMDPDSDDMPERDPTHTFFFKSKDAPRRTMRWGHGHPTWTHYALPWLARWTSYVLAPEKTAAPAWLTEQGFVSDEPLMNFASWADGLTKQWCKFDIPNPDYYYAQYLTQSVTLDQSIPRGSGEDRKYFPRGIPLMYLSAHAAKEPEASHRLLSMLWNPRDDERKSIFYDGKWFNSGEALRQHDPSLKCIT